MQQIVTAAGLKIDRCWTMLFAEAVKGHNIMEFIGLEGVDLTHIKTKKEQEADLKAEERAIDKRVQSHM